MELQLFLNDLMINLISFLEEKPQMTRTHRQQMLCEYFKKTDMA